MLNIVDLTNNAKPLNKTMLHWFFKYTLKTPDDAKNELLDLDNVSAGKLQGLPPATVITDQLDPLHDEGKALAERLQQAGVKVQYRNYEGVTHEFFGMGAVVDKAKEAEMFAADGLKSAFTAQ